MIFWIAIILLLIMSLTTINCGSAPVDKKNEQERNDK